MIGVMIQEVRPEDAQAVGERIADGDPAVLATLKQALWQALETGLSEARGAVRDHRQ